MINVQRLIKYFAIAFAAILIVNIILFLGSGLSFLGKIFIKDTVTVSTKLESLDISRNIKVLDVDVSSSNIYFKESNSFQVDTNNDNITYKFVDDRLVITEKKSIINFDDNNDLVFYIPKDYTFDVVNIDSGAGMLEINNLNSNILNLDLGAGQVIVNKIYVLNKAEIDGGAGKIEINEGVLHNLDLELGVGNLSLASKLEGTSKIDGGIGKIDLLLFGSLNDYKVLLDKELGSAKIQNVNMKNDTFYGNGFNEVFISGGIGSINIDFKN